MRRLLPTCLFAALLPAMATSAAPATSAPDAPPAANPVPPHAAARLAKAVPAPDPLLERLARNAPALDRDVLRIATRALGCAMRQPGATAPRTLGVIDYSLPSTQRRLWVFDLRDGALLFEEWVAHGRNTGENLATRFSNVEGSFQSSIGAFLTEESYVGRNGYSLRLRGLEPGFNDLARERAIVVHGAPYVNPQAAAGQGRLGRSLGCPAVRPAIARELIDTIRGGSLLVAYYPDPEWLRTSELLLEDCAGARLASHGATADAVAAH
ncbi:murein L,D-transpeptidase catalytic domain family protein [Luteimonas huabeiensis]|uniref:murein L,D-transpeptidase catalytic domain family protein n=1 Tax=Luteimonas huabeiensis TaxID=1244513 RepID=UPI000465230F|nr:murein L,D-transpeptidase catalytic domain family protein [Luteimonas huabeiensis]